MILDDLNRFYSLLNLILEMDDQEGVNALVDVIAEKGFVYTKQLAYRIECIAREIDQPDQFDQLDIASDIRNERRAGLLRLTLRKFQTAEKLWRKLGLYGIPGATRCLEGQIRVLEQQGERKQAADLYDTLCRELSKYSSQYERLANNLNECVETLIDDEAWSQAEKQAKHAYIASIQAWRVASHPFVHISLQNLASVLKKLGKESASERVRIFLKKNQSKSNDGGDSGHCCKH